MALINELRSSKSNEIVALAEFLRMYFKGSKMIYCFVEAKDDEIYYRSVMRSLTSRQFETFPCNGKQGVIRVYKALRHKRKYRKACTGFFVDRDYDPPLKKKRIYETPYHSIESFYCSHEIVKKVLYHAFNISRLSEDFNLCVRLYINGQAIFHKRTLKLNSFLACHADLRTRQKFALNIDDKVQFRDIVANDLVTINCNNFTFKELRTRFNVGDAISRKKLKRKKRYFLRKEMHKIFRGKFELAYLLSYLKMLKHVVENPNQNILSRAYPVKIHFRKEDILTVLSPYAEVPESLRGYIKKIAS